MVQLTILNVMAGDDFVVGLDRHVAWGLKLLDLKEWIFGKGILDLSDAEARKVMELARHRGLAVHCLSTCLMNGLVEEGERQFRASNLPGIERVIQIAAVLRPRMIRLLTAQTSKRAELRDSSKYLQEKHPWLIPFYQEAVDRIHAAGFEVTIENEVKGCIFSTPTEAGSFFEALDRRGKAHFTWDVQNLWQRGTFPSLEVYRALKPHIGYLHVKGGQAERPGGALRWSSALDDASWPVAEIVRQAVADQISPVICLNPPHGEKRPGYDYSDITGRDLAYVRKVIG